MISKWLGNVDFGKLTLDATVGFIVSLAILFVIDVFTPDHVIENILDDTSAGSIVVAALIVVVAAGILGLMADSIFHTFGRYFAKKFWKPLRFELDCRDTYMEDVGLRNTDFHWVYAKTQGEMNTEIEKKYMRFTEVAGAAAYAILLLLTPASLLFLRLEYLQEPAFSIYIAIFIAIGGLVLLLTSAASLAKYERLKTSITLDDIRKLSSRFRAKKTPKRLWFSPRLLWLLIPIAIVAALLLWMNAVADNKKTEMEEQMSMIVISQPVTNAKGDKELPTIDIAVASPVTIAGRTGSQAVILNDVFRSPKNLLLKDKDEKVVESLNLVDTVKLSEVLKWKLFVSLHNDENVMWGDRIYIHARIHFDKLETVPANQIEDGDWLFPIVVSVEGDNNNYLLAQVHVHIGKESSENGDRSETDEKADDEKKS